MTRRMLSMRCAVALAVAVCAASAAAAEAPAKGAKAPAGPVLKAGFAERDITPAVGMEQPGGYGKSFHRVLHDPCKVRAVVFDDGKQRVALVGIDALIIRRPSVEAARQLIARQCPIPPEAILIGASHSHSSGPVGMVLPGEFDHASPLVQQLAYEKSSCADAGYLKHVELQIADAVCTAYRQRVEVRCGVGKGIEDRVAYNRRFRMKNGLSFTHPGKGNPDIVETAGPTDPEVGVIGVWDLQGKFLGCTVNFCCHATAGPGGVSANWIYYMEQAIRGMMGGDSVVVFLQGCCGDVTQVDNLNPDVNPTAERWSRMVGGRVGAEAVKVLVSMETGSLVPLASQVKYLDIKRRVPSKQRVADCLAMVAKEPKEVGATNWTFAKEILMLDAMLVKEPVKRVEVQAIQVGPAVFLTNPAEFFCQLGLDIKKGSPFPYTFPVELANDCVGYVPTEEAMGKNGGGYETRLTAYSNLEPTAGRQMVNAAIELARQLKPGDVPQPAKAPQGKAWEYGNVPPELE